MGRVLIVPYGIEIYLRQKYTHIPVVLIVPYGIEITFQFIACCNFIVLIVPYGIEITVGQTVFLIDENVLIVPYGIEISYALNRSRTFSKY